MALLRSAQLGELISRLDDTGNHLVSANMPRPHEVELRFWPRLGQEPRDVRRSADVESAVDERRRNAGEEFGVLQQLPVVEPRGVAEIVSHDAGERHSERGIGIPRVRGPALLERDDRVLPVAPVTGRLLTDFRIGEDLRARQDILKKFGFTQNDVQLVETWFFADPAVANPEKLSGMLKELGVFSARSSALEGIASSLKALFNPVLLYLFVSAAILAIARPSRRVLGAWLLFMAGIVALGFLGRPAVFRVYIPALTMLLIAPYLAGEGPLRHGRICLAVLLVAAILNAGTVFSESRSFRLSDEQVRGHMPKMPKDPLVVWGGGFPFEAMYPVLNPPVEAMAYKIYGFGVSTLAPFSVARHESLAGRGFVARLTSDEGVPMIANEMLFGYLSIYCKEHHQAVLEELKKETFGQYSMSWRRCKK